MKIGLLTSLILLVITGCTTNPPLKSNPNVPKVTELRTLSDRNSIGLEWDIVNKPEIAGYYIQRSSDARKYKTVAKIDNRYISHWVDRNLKPNKTYYYKISTYTTKGVPSFAIFKQVKTLPTIEAVPFIKNDNLKVKGMIKIIFRPHPNERVKGYYIQRINNSGKWETIAKIEPRLSAEYIDKGLEDGKLYRYRVIAYTWDGLKSYPSRVISAQTLQRPQVVLNISATINKPHEIDLQWQAIKGSVEYKIYYASSEDGRYSLLATTKNNFYVDKISKNGYKRFYKITSVDKYGVESIPSQAVMGSTMPAPVSPIVSITQDSNSVTFLLTSPDKRAVKYLIKKDDGKRIINIHNVHSSYVDKDVLKSHSYLYKIYAIDKNGLVSKPKEVEVSF